MIENHVIIDANIAQSCADPARHETSRACLQLMRIIGDKSSVVDLLITPLLHDEWQAHASRTFKRWWAGMESRRRVRREGDKRVADYRAAIDALSSPKARREVEKDAHIVEAALLHGVPVASRDDAQAGYVLAMIETYPLAGNVQWMNPVTDEHWADWLASGCTDGSRALRHRLKN